MLQSISLLDRIEHFELDDPSASLPFSARLARENGWSRVYAERVITEYKRFIYLTTISRHPVTPSVAVDEAWHLHLTYTRSYWEQLCGDVLGKPLHHEPTRGGAAENTKFHDLYSQTLALYEQTFASAPPPDIWPSVAERFAPQAQTLHVSPATHWIIRKRSLPKMGMLPKLAVAALVVLLTAGWMVPGPQQEEVQGIMSLLFVLAGGLVALVSLVTAAFLFAFVISAILKEFTSSSAGQSSGHSAGGGGDCGGGDGCGGGGCGGGGCGGGGCGGGGCGGGG
jgi:hypothetical protein